MTASASCLRSAVGLALTGAFVVFFAGCTTTVRQHSGFAERFGTISHIGVMPPEVEVVRIVFRGDNEPLRAEEQTIEERLPGLISRQLGVSDRPVNAVEFDGEMLAEFPDLRFELSQLQGAYVEALHEMYETPAISTSEAKKYDRTLGPQVNLFADLAEADALVLCHFSGFKKSGGERAEDIAMTVLIAVATLGSVINPEAGQGAILHVSLVDGITGDILWSNRVQTTGDFESGGLAKMVENAFEEFGR
ncbi:MAG: hypothetical protein JSU66_04250 [Deltaproteobacteria bacterium]|nr:MAG: hypothetical protein JSU66_04250 [Deltaproteobacteria bacterium]